VLEPILARIATMIRANSGMPVPGASCRVTLSSGVFARSFSSRPAFGHPIVLAYQACTPA
jgi:hypothetical protein